MSDSSQLVESRPKLLQLSSYQREELERMARDLAGSGTWWGASIEDPVVDRRVVRIESRGDSYYSVTVLDAIGVIGLPGLTLFVAPKIPFDHFSHIARRSFVSSERVGHTEAEMGSGHHFLDLVARWFLNALMPQLQLGLVLDYREVTDRQTAVRGSVNMLPTVTRWLRGDVAVDCRFDEFVLDTPLNRVLRGACRALATSASLNPDLRALASRAARRMEGVGDLIASDTPIVLDRSTQRFSGPASLAQHILQATGRELFEGNSRAQSFLFRTPELIEDGIRNILSDGLSPMSVTKRGRVLVPSTLRVNPDLELGPPPFTGDVKYKITDDKWHRPDLAQSVFFAAAYRSPRALVLSFTQHRNIQRPALAVGNIRVRSTSWDVSEGTTPEAAEDLMVQSVRDFIKAA